MVMHDYHDTEDEDEKKDEYQGVLLEVGEDQGGEGPTNVLLPKDVTRALRNGSCDPLCGNFAPEDGKHAPKDGIHDPLGGTGGRPRPDRPRCRCPDTSAIGKHKRGYFTLRVHCTLSAMRGGLREEMMKNYMMEKKDEKKTEEGGE